MKKKQKIEVLTAVIAWHALNFEGFVDAIKPELEKAIASTDVAVKNKALEAILRTIGFISENMGEYVNEVATMLKTDIHYTKLENLKFAVDKIESEGEELLKKSKTVKSSCNKNADAESDTDSKAECKVDVEVKVVDADDMSELPNEVLADFARKVNAEVDKRVEDDNKKV